MEPRDIENPIGEEDFRHQLKKEKCNGNCGMNYCDEYGCIDNKQSADDSNLLDSVPPLSGTTNSSKDNTVK